MLIKTRPFLFITVTLGIVFLSSCKPAPKPPAVDIVSSPEQLNESATDNIRKSLRFADVNNGDLGDSTITFAANLLQIVYEKNNYTPIWSSTEQWKPLADSLYRFIEHSMLYGLFPEDYHFAKLSSI